MLVHPKQVHPKMAIAVGGSHLSGIMQTCNGHGMNNQRTKVGKRLDIRKKKWHVNRKILHAVYLLATGFGCNKHGLV